MIKSCLLKLLLFLVIQASCLFSSSYRFHLSDAWYQSSGKRLAQQILDLEKLAKDTYEFSHDKLDICAAICPHAGYAYSGAVASSVYQLIKSENIKRVVILAPSHHEYCSGVRLPAQEYNLYKSPLGLIKLDIGMIHKLKRTSSLFVHDHKIHELEHSIEVQIPFIQTYFTKSQIVPLIIGEITSQQAQTLAKILQPFFDENTLCLVSTDFMHYGSIFDYVPFSDNILMQIYKIDHSLIDSIANFNYAKFIEIVQQTKIPICGKYPLMIFFNLLERKAFGNIKSYVISYDTSSHEDQPTQVISFAGMVFAKQKL